MKNYRSILIKHSKSFSKFSVIGGSFYVFATIGNGIVIDYLGVNPLLGVSIVMGLLFVLKYWAYRLLKVMRAGFLAYCSGNIFMTLIGIALIWLLVDQFGMSGYISTLSIYGSLFVIRYLVFVRLKLIKH